MTDVWLLSVETGVGDGRSPAVGPQRLNLPAVTLSVGRRRFACDTLNSPPVPL